MAISHKVYKATLPRFLSVCSHPVSFAALRHLSSVTLPVNFEWEHYISEAERVYKDLMDGVGESLRGLAEEALALMPATVAQDENNAQAETVSKAEDGAQPANVAQDENNAQAETLTSTSTSATSLLPLALCAAFLAARAACFSRRGSS